MGIGRFGLAARCRFLCYRLFIIQAARQSDPSEARGEALQTLFQQPNGPWILGVVAVWLPMEFIW